MSKYNRFTADGEDAGLKIDLARNFRSRREVLHGTNYIFQQIMGKTVGEIEYDDAALLITGAPYPTEKPYPVELAMIDMEGAEKDEAADEESTAFDVEDLAQSQLEARYMAGKIKEIISGRQEVFNMKTGAERPAMYRDIVILLRSMTWAPQIMEEFKQQGIPVYANLSSGYFEATEVSIMMSLLKVIDNPYQDIPLAAVLRSPIVGLDEAELAKIRIVNKRGSLYEALKEYCLNGTEKAISFYEAMHAWRQLARQGSVSELIWQLYRETRFYDFVGGMPGGKQRQANLRALYDRARQYEETSFRGLFRFLRFIERMLERGDDLGAARALGEQEDVVRLMTIHSSKGLEFPFVFIAGLGRNFNTMDLKKSYMLDKEFGFAAKYVNTERRVSYPSLPQLAFKRKKKMEMLAEEMRVLYVALTRAKEKLYLVSSVKSANKKIGKWLQAAAHPAWLLNEFERAQAGSYLDWIGPSLVRHQDCSVILGADGQTGLIPDEILKHPSCWKVEVLKKSDAAAVYLEEEEEMANFFDYVQRKEPVPIESTYKELAEKQLLWRYAYEDAASHRSKQSVSEVKRQKEIFHDEASSTEMLRKFKKPLYNRPKFMQEKTMTPAERGTAMHMLMQHMEMKEHVTFEMVEAKLGELVQKELLTEEQMSVIDASLAMEFFHTELAERLRNAHWVKLEVPFSYTVPASKIYNDWQGSDDPVLIQGIMDCIFADERGVVLLDYKTDSVTERFHGKLEEAKTVLQERYRIQMDMYAEALEQILKIKVDERYLYFFDGALTIKI